MNPNQLEQLYSMLKSACDSSDTQSQQKVFNQLSAAQHNVQFYIGLASIASNQQVEIKCRQMALLALKSALKRNENQIAFTEEQFAYFRGCIINTRGCENEIMENSQKSLISLLALWEKKIDFEILSYLLKQTQSQIIAQRVWALQTLYIIFQDIKFETQNLQCFDKPQFSQFLQKYTATFVQNIKQNNEKLIEKSLLCMNLLLKYMKTMDKNAQTLKFYLSTYLIPILTTKHCSDRILEITLDGITEIAETDCSLILGNDLVLSTITKFQSEKTKVLRNWLSLFLDLVDNDNEQEKIKVYLPLLVPKIINNLVFTKEDELNVKMEMEEENNPYQYENEEESENSNYKGNDFSYTNRKLSVLLLERLIVQFTEQIWNICTPIIKHLFSSQNNLQRQQGVLMLGVIFEKMEDHLEFLQLALPVVIAFLIDPNSSELLKCTCLWSIGKIAYLIVRQDSLNKQIQSCLIQCLQNSQNKVRDTVYSALDELICCSEQLPFYLQQIILSIESGIKNCQGKPLYSVLKTCSTLYQRHPQKIPQEITNKIVKQLCLKWSTNSKIQSIMSPILQCLVTISSANSKVLKIHAFQIFKEAFNILQNINQKTMVIRAIDLLSSIINMQESQVLQAIRNDENFHNKLHSLLTSNEREIKNFSYGLLGDICKVTAIPKFAQGYLQIIGNSFDENSLTSCSNALTCLADLIIANPSLVQKYSKTVMALAIKKLNAMNLQHIYAFNFARVYGRLSYLNPVDGSQMIKQNLSRICSGLRSREQQKLTDDAYRGIFQMILLAPQQLANCFEYLVQSFVCYPCGDRQVSQMFISILKSFRQSLNPQQWHLFLNKPIFLPAVAKKVQLISA